MLKPAEKHAFFVMLRRLAERRGGLPERMMITENIEVSDKIHALSAFGEVRLGTYKGDYVAVKTARVPSLRDLTKTRKVNINDILPPTPGAVSIVLLQQFYREVVLWSTLSHANILKLVGVKEDVEKRQFAAVSEWMGGSNIMEFIKEHPVNRLELVRDFTFSAASHAKTRR